MNQEEKLQVDQSTLVSAWQQTLPTRLNPGDQAKVLPDGANPKALVIHIDTAGRQMYSFDFHCAYVDTREVKLNLIDVEKSGVHIDERTEVVQELVQNYMRHIHECAQALHDVTNHGQVH
ncbi:hypothetical protein [Paenibacillus alvei]|uniref:hypothetical protein n=1 Tax=Paenibacillus alvei TaxID=44250 RepID=UPI002281AA20|nr:hypothetical protein [Paenibacillus alvei]MCY7487246.1 hypothetical protein [Paenibacillus alvei]